MTVGKVNDAEASEFRFAGYPLDLKQGRLWEVYGDVQLRPKAFARSGYMVRHAGRVLSKKELLDAVWPDVMATEASLAKCVHVLRVGVGPAGQCLGKTAPRWGYLYDFSATAAPEPTGDPSCLRGNENIHAPLLCVAEVDDVASGDLSLRGQVNQ